MIRPRAAAVGLLVLALLVSPDLLPAPPNPLSSLALSPTSVLGGSPSTGTVTLANAAPAGGAIVALTSSNGSAATVPPNVTVTAGQTSKTFTITTSPVAASTAVTITATYSSGSRSATLTVTPAALTSVAVSPASVPSGTASTGTVTLNGPAPAGGGVVTLSSSSPGVASVPGSVTVPSGSTSATFAITTFNVASSTAVTISAVYKGTTKTTTLTVTPAPPAIAALAVNPASAVGGASVNGTATLNQAAPTGGAVVALSSSDPAVASVPASVTVPAGSISIGFVVTTSTVPADTSATISGSYGGVTKTASLAVISTFTLTLDDGSGPIYTNLSTVGVKGRVAPTSVGPSVLVRGTLGAQNVTVTPASSGAFTLPNLTLPVGSNAVSVTGTAGSQTVGPVPATYVYDNVAPTASVVVSTNVPNPTNVATWTLSGTITGYQGATENAFVYLNGGSTRFPIAANGTWSGSYTLVEGRNSIPFAVADLAGNVRTTGTHNFYLDTLGLKPVFSVGDLAAAGNNFSWPGMLDELVTNYLHFASESGASLNGSHLDVYFDEQGSFPAGSPVNCAPDNLTCIVARKAVPDMSIDFTPTTVVAHPRMSMGIHTIRMVLRDPFGNVHERGGLLPVWHRSQGGSTAFLPVGNFGVPGTVTTQRPKLVGRTGGGVPPLDCNDNPGTRIPAFSYWNPQQGGSWQTLAVTSTSVTGGVFQATPTANIPVTTNASGQKVLRIKLTEGVVRLNGFGNEYLEGTFGRNICSGQTVIWSLMKNVIVYVGPPGPVAGAIYDLPYRSSSNGDDPAPLIDTSAVTDVATDTSGPYTHSVRLRVSDLNGDLDYRNVTVATTGCADSSCTYPATLIADQLLSTALPGGYFKVALPLAVGPNSFVATARDDVGNVTNKSFTVTRSLTEVEAKITSPTTASLYAFCSPKSVTFDASQSVNRGPNPMRFQWTDGSFTLLSNPPTYTETLQSAGSRRVIVSTSTAVPNPGISNPCGAPIPAGQCSIATVNVQPFAVPTGTLPAQILSPANGASVPNDVTVTLDGTVGQNADPSYVYKWRLRRTSDGVYYPIPQSTGTGSDPSYAVGNRTLTLRLDSITGVVAGNYTLLFDAAYQTSPGSCIAQQSTSSIGITVTAKVYTATGVAPGTTLPGATATRLYGTGFDAAARIAISGPVRSLTGTELCTMPACPQVVVPATAGVDGTTLDFVTPANLTPGFYLVFASDPSTGAASSAFWLEVQPAQGAATPKTQEFSNRIHSLVNGQTLTGEFLEGRDTSGKYSDVDYYYFFATAGSGLSLSLTRTDTSLPWEAPDSIDPELHVADPDGVIWQGFESLDNQTGVDLNASIGNLVLPKTGRYTVYAATSKGFGPYELAYTLTPAAPDPANQILPATNNDRTVKLETSFRPMAFALDKRGYPLSGAMTQFVATPETGETGQIVFPEGANFPTSTRGFVEVVAKLTLPGKVSFESLIRDPGLIVPQSAMTTQGVPAVPRYRPVATVVTLQTGSIDPLTGATSATFGSIERLELLAPEKRAVVERVSETTRPAPGMASAGGHVPNAAEARSPDGRMRTLSADAITTCSPKQFHAAGVDAERVEGPFNVTLTDLTPKTGETSGEEVIGVEGVNGHRVDKTIRIRIEIKDSLGVEPNYPVLVHLYLAGTTPGTLFLDPDGARIPCQSASFLWHEIGPLGEIIPNDEFEYELGTTAVFADVKPDPQIPGEVLPVWGTTEVLGVFFGTFDDETGNLTNQYSAKHGVHPEPGTPDHFEWNPTSPLPPHRFEFFAAYVGSFPSEVATFTNNGILKNLYYLVDEHGNRTFGHSDTAATDPAVNVNMTFSAQEPDWETESPIGYKLRVDWNDNPSGGVPKASSQWPDGAYVSTLTISGSDPETGPFSISQAFTAVFSQPLFYDLYSVTGYDQPIDIKYDDSVEPPVDLERVSPGAARMRLNGDLVRNSILLVRGTRLSFFSFDTLAWPRDPPYDPEFVTDGVDSFDISLVDEDGELRSDAEIQVAFCPKFNESIRGPCPLGNRTSAGGVILGVRPIDRGYMGLMVSRAPTAPGHYFFRIRPLPSNVHPWRVSESPDPQYAGYTESYALTVGGGEFLDENFQRFLEGTVRVTQPTLVYLRYYNSSGRGPGTAELRTMRQDGTELQSGVSLNLARLGSSRYYIGEFTGMPEGDPSAPPAGRPSIAVAFGGGRMVATQTAASTMSARHSLSPQSINGSVLAEVGTAFPGTLRLRYLQRGSTCADETCLTQPGTVNEGKFQETAIDPDVKYAEVVRILVDSYSPYQPSRVQDINLKLDFHEIDNDRYLDDPSAGKYRRFYEGINLSSRITSDGKLFDHTGAEQTVTLDRGRAVFTLYSVATARYENSSPNDVVGTSPIAPYAGEIRVNTSPVGAFGPLLPIESTPLTVKHWVDERRYARSRSNPGGSWEAGSGFNGALDWLEMRVLDYCAQGEPLSSEGNSVLARPSAVWVNWDLEVGVDGKVYSDAPSVIHIKPERRFLRYDAPPAPWITDYFYGLARGYDPADGFRRFISHEARHSWQYTLKPVDGLTDGDNDFLFESPPASSPELKDAGHPANPEFNFDGDSFVDPEIERQTAWEWNADRFATANVPGSLGCASIRWSSLSYGSSPPQLLGQLTFTAGSAADQPLPGALIRIERGSGCNSGTGWTLVEYRSTGSGGWVSYPLPASGDYRFTLVPPRECGSAVISSCRTVP